MGIGNRELNGAGVESRQAKWDEMFGVKKDEVVKEVKVKKPRKKAVASGNKKKESQSKSPQKKIVTNKKASSKKKADADA